MPPPYPAPSPTGYRFNKLTDCPPGERVKSNGTRSTRFRPYEYALFAESRYLLFPFPNGFSHTGNKPWVEAIHEAVPRLPLTDSSLSEAYRYYGLE